MSLLHRLEVDAEDAFFDQVVLAAPGSLSQSDVFLRRVSGLTPEDSGWLLGNLNDPESLNSAANLEAVPIAHLVAHRPALLEVLTLSTGFIAVFEDEILKQVFDAAGRSLLVEDADEIGEFELEISVTP